MLYRQDAQCLRAGLLTWLGLELGRTNDCGLGDVFGARSCACLFSTELLRVA
jgi:hypothetical protein